MLQHERLQYAALVLLVAFDGNSLPASEGRMPALNLCDQDDVDVSVSQRRERGLQLMYNANLSHVGDSRC